LKKYRFNEALSCPPAQAPTDFIPLRVVLAEPAAQSFECAIEYPSGIIVRFNGPVNAAVVAQLIPETET